MVDSKKMIIVRFLFKFIPISHFHNLKSSLLRWSGVSVGKNVQFFSSAKIIGNMTLSIGDNCFIGHETLILGPAGSSIILEDFVIISSRVILVTGTHRFSSSGNCVVKEGIYKDIIISKGAGISIGATVLPGVTVGKMSLVGAGAVVSSNVPENALVGGVPAEFIKHFKPDA